MIFYFDTDFLVALNDKSDSNYERSVKIAQRLANFPFTSSIGVNVILETLTIISQKIGSVAANNLLQLIVDDFEIVYLDKEMFESTNEIFISRASKNISYSDCASFSIMNVHKIEWVFSFDTHFKKYGFKRIGLDGFPS